MCMLYMVISTYRSMCRPFHFVDIVVHNKRLYTIEDLPKKYIFEENLTTKYLPPLKEC